MSASTRSTSRNWSAQQLRRAVPFGDLTVIWAKGVADGQVKGFVVANDLPGFSTTKLEDKIALRIVQNAVITLDDVRVDEQDRLQNANTFRDTAEVLRLTRAGVAWMAVGCARSCEPPFGRRGRVATAGRLVITESVDWPRNGLCYNNCLSSAEC